MSIQWSITGSKSYVFARIRAFGLDPNKPSSSSQDMNADLSLISSWGRNNDLKFGLKKCKVMWFQKKRDKQNFSEIIVEGEVLEQAHEFKYLGLILDEGLTFEAHKKQKNLGTVRYE